ncbi:MAG: hypothetical protein JWM27_135 [Gemmatimonadetes bacterium]|nr:hypothetical protein [Gemmatimonadota bacterium]
MAKNDAQNEKATRVARELGSALKRQARRRWETVRTAERNEGPRHVWRFKPGPDGTDRFLYVTHEALTTGEDPTPVLLEQLKAGRWLDRLDGAETTLVLSKGGSLEAA